MMEKGVECEGRAADVQKGYEGGKRSNERVRDAEMDLEPSRRRGTVRAARVDEQGGIRLRPPERRRLREHRRRRRRAVVFYLHRARIIHGYARNASLVDDVDGRDYVRIN